MFGGYLAAREVKAVWESYAESGITFPNSLYRHFVEASLDNELNERDSATRQKYLG